MPTNSPAFPWGIHIGDLTDENSTIPVYLPSQAGGFCVLFDDNSLAVANNFIENVALNLFANLPAGAITADVFDFSHRQRFMHLAALHNAGLYQIALGVNPATQQFNALESLALHRHHHLLSFKAPTLSDYNQTSPLSEKYHLVLINLEHYPDDVASYKRIKEFFDAAYEAGFYCIAYANLAIVESDNKATRYFLQRYPHIEVLNQQVQLNETVFEFADLALGYDFEYLNTNKQQLVDNLLDALHQDQPDKGTDFLSLPIGTSANGLTEINFSLGKKSENNHAFITGVTGSGKTTLLNNLILGIAHTYNPQQVRLYLMDYKKGVEFQIFKNHPNCEKLFLDNEDLQAAINLLEEFTHTLKERGKLFTQQEVNNIDKYNQHYPQTPLPRIILIIDEVHKLFAGTFSQKDRFSELLEDVARRGGGFGIHIILSTQTLAGTHIDRELMSQITLRLSFKLTDPRDAETIFTYGNTDAVTLAKHTLIYNTDAGNKAANVLCRAFPPQDIKTVLKDIIASKPAEHILTPKIATSASDQSHQAKPEPPKSPPPINSSQYDTQSAKKLLAKLAAEGKIKLPPGFDTDSKGD